MIKAKTGIPVDMPDVVGVRGASTTGNTARALLFYPEKRLNVSHRRLGQIKNLTGLYLMNLSIDHFESYFL